MKTAIKYLRERYRGNAGEQPRNGSAMGRRVPGGAVNSASLFCWQNRLERSLIRLMRRPASIRFYMFINSNEK